MDHKRYPDRLFNITVANFDKVAVYLPNIESRWNQEYASRISPR